MEKQKGSILISVIIALVVIGIGIAIYFIFFAKPTLTVNVTPNDSLIFLDGSETPESNRSFKVSKGDHKLRISKDGYLEESFDLAITKSRTLNVVLYKNTAFNFTQTQDLENSTAPILTKDGLISFNSTSNSFTQISNNQTNTITLPQGLKVANIASSGSKLLIETAVDYTSPTSPEAKHYIYDLEAKKLTELDVSAFDPVSSISLSPEDGVVIVAGNYKQHGNLVSLFKYNYTLGTSEKLASDIPGAIFVPLNKTNVLIIRTQDAADQPADTASIFNEETKLLSNFVSSPDFLKNPIINQSNPLVFYLGKDGLTSKNYENGNVSIIPYAPDFNFDGTWVDNSNLILINKDSNTAFKVNVDNKSVSPEIPLKFFPGKVLNSVTYFEGRLVYTYIDLNNGNITLAYSGNL